MPAEIPGIEIENHYETESGPSIQPRVEKESMDVRRLALAAHANAGLSVVDTPLATTRGLDNPGVSNDAPVIDLIENHSLLSRGVHRTANQEMVNGGNNSSNDKGDGIPYLRH